MHRLFTDLYPSSLLLHPTNVMAALASIHGSWVEVLYQTDYLDFA